MTEGQNSDLGWTGQKVKAKQSASSTHLLKLLQQCLDKLSEQELISI